MGAPSSAPTALVVGSGPIGSAYARLLVGSGWKVTMVESGAQLSARPGEHLANGFTYQQLPNLFNDMILGRLERFSIPRALFSRTGYRVAFANPRQKRWRGMPMASAIYAVGGMATHWTCCCPDPQPFERTPLIPEGEWEGILDAARRLLWVHHDAFEPSLVGAAVKRRLLSAGWPVENLPMAAAARDEKPPYAHCVTWTGADTVLGPLADDPASLRDRFTLLPEHRAELIRYQGPRVTGVEVRNLQTYTRQTFEADLYIVAGGPFLTPRLLWQSGIRPYALGRFLNDNTTTSITVRLKPELLREIGAAPGNTAAGEPLPIPYDDAEPMVGFAPTPERPWHGQVHRAGRKFFYTVRHDTRDHIQLTWYGMVEPRPDNRITFEEDLTDRFDQPQITIDYRWSGQDLRRAARMWWDMVRAGRALGKSSGIALLAPPGTTLHYQSTYRMGDDAKQDENESVVDTYSRVWGFDNLYLGGVGVIPNQMAANPTLTACAFAVRSVSRILDQPVEQLTASLPAPASA